MKQLPLVTSILLFLATLGQAQVQHQAGFDVGVGFNKVNYYVPSNVHFITTPDLSSQVTPGIMAALKYDLILAKHLHLGIGVGAEMKEAYEQEIETTNLLLPIEIGYRSLAVGNMYLTGDLLLMPHLVVQNGRTIYYANSQGNGEEAQFLPIDHRPLNLQLGVKLGVGWKLSKRLDLQLNLLGRTELFKDSSEDTLLDKKYWGILLNTGLRFTL